MNELAVADRSAPLTAQQIKQNRMAINLLMRQVMKEGEDYGTIPGSNKPSLRKPGSEKVLAMFHLAVRPRVEDLSGPDFVKYRITVELYIVGSDTFVGAGVGECSSDEEKYRWREAVCQEEWQEANEVGLARKKYKNSSKGPYSVLQVRTHHADIANTVLKMAKKRAQIDATLTATAASDFFTQEVGDDEDPKTASSNGAERKQPSTGAPIVSSKQAGLFYARWKEKIAPDRVKAYLKDVCGVDDSRKMPLSKFDAALKWVEEDGPDWKKDAPAETKQQAPEDDDRGDAYEGGTPELDYGQHR